jgi:NADPH:quinone reductase-like Zn-dependent oxidoreductase
VGEVAKTIAFRGLLNIVGNENLADDSLVDAGRLHYHYTAYVGTRDHDISSAYGESKNRCELRPGGTALFAGSGGPMGQMHIQRAIEKKDGPSVIIATEVKQERASVLKNLMEPLAKTKGITFRIFNPNETSESLEDFLFEVTGERKVDDAVICAPVAQMMEDSARLLKPDGMLVCFAGVAIGTYINVNLSNIYLGSMQLSGTSGSRLSDQKMILKKTMQGELNTNRSVAAVGGMYAARNGLEALVKGTFTGKIIIFPQIEDLPLLSLNDLKKKYPEIGEKYGPNDAWTVEAEKALIEKLWGNR